MNAEISGPWSRAQIRRHLDASAIPIRLACQAPSGFPLVASLWYVQREGALWCATTHAAAVARLLAREPRCGFEVAGDAPPYRGVRGRARARLDPAAGEEILRALIERYLGAETSPLARWLLSRVSSEVAIRIDPERLVSWDYSERMGDSR